MKFENIAIVVILIKSLAGPAFAAQEIVIRNVQLVTMIEEENIVLGKAVIVEGGAIKAIVRDAPSEFADDAIIIDGGGGYLTPGLIDAHVHHYDPVPYLNYIANGVTTVIGLGQRDGGESFLALRNAINAGDEIGPGIYTTSKTIASHIDIEDPDEARAYVRSLKADGFDLVKIYNNTPKPVFDAVVDEARRNDLSVFGHLPRNFPVQYALSHGLDVVAHAEEFYFAYFGGPRDQQLADFDGSAIPDLSKMQEVIDLMVEHEVALIPDFTFTFVTMKFWDDEDAVLADPEIKYWPAIAYESWKENNGARRDQIGKRMLRDRIKYNLMHELTRRASAAGVLIVTGTDAPERGVISGRSLHSEMRELVKSGLSFEKSLAAATRNGGELINKYIDADARLGVIAPGYEADLILVADNPLEDIRNMQAIEAVMTDGVWHDRQTLKMLRNDLAAQHQQAAGE